MSKAACRFDLRAWLAWLLAGSIVVMVAGNPAYSLMVLLAALLVQSRCARPEQTLPLPFIRLAVLVLALSVLFNVAFVHVGTTVLLRFPADWPLIGGPLTLEAAVAGLANGLIILALLALFLAFNAVVRSGELVRLVPRAFHDLSMVLLIALTYVPETARHWQRIREAQAVRGHQMQSWRDWPPLLLPLFVGGLERAMTLSETLVARGFNAPAGQALPNWRRGLFLGVLLLALLGWALAVWRGWPGGLLFLVAAALLVGLIWQAGRRVKRTVYRPGQWQLPDSLLLTLSLVVLLVIGLTGSANLQYAPYPRLSLPPFDPLVGITMMLLAYPAVASH